MRKLLLLLLIFSSCTPRITNISNQSARELISTDKAMSDLAAQIGFNKALLQYADENVIKPQEGQKSIIGKPALTRFWGENAGPKTLTWEPYKAEASKSGDMGYTVGHWTFVIKNSTLHGDYYTIWKKQSDGKWKFVLDAGNSTP